MKDEDAKAVLQHAQELYQTNNCERPELLAHIQELLQELASA